MKYEEKIKFAVLLFWAPSTNSLAESQKVQTQRRHSMTRTDLHCWHRRVARDPFTCAHLTSGPNPQMFSGKTTDMPALHLCVEGVTASISKSDIIGAAIKK
ncbi:MULTISPECIES: hypothetical protein [unclassified Microcoleus]|uniref:hypothetical protein n=1 Tax=unclassified Microcoleus TaxID=2642155 RepID=UPI002FCE8DC5